MQKVDVAIIGAGIAGLSAAVACSRQGIEAHVYEAAPAFAPLGTSLSLWPNAMACLADWDLALAAGTAGRVINTVAWRRADGRAYFEQPMSELYSEAGHQGVCIKRADLHHILLSAMAEDQLHPDHRLVAVTPEGDGCVLDFDSGTRIKAHHVIGADGVGSRLRAQTLDDEPPNYAGYGAWLGHTDAPFSRATAGEGCEYFGPNGRLGVFETGGGQRYWFLVANTAIATEQAQAADLDRALELTQGWPDDLRNLIGTSNPADCVYVSFYDRPIAKQWGKGPVTLIGDALHPIVPNLGQGACQAIEDGAAIAAILAKGARDENVSYALAALRRARLDYMYKTARRTGQLAQSNSSIARSAMRLFSLPPLSAMVRADFRKQFQRIV